ncbi:MAG: M1 family aminopeptidase [Pyrinomonadaceae bacterium]
MELFSGNSEKVNYRKIADGSFIAEKPFDSFSYRLSASIPPNILTVAHISWIYGDNGILKLNDLLPVFEMNNKTTVSIELPEKWKISTVEQNTGQNEFAVRRNENAVFVIGRGWSEHKFSVSGANINLILDDKWTIEKNDIEKIIKEILLEYESYFGTIPQKNLEIINFKFPKDVGFERWRAETNGGNIIIMSAQTTFESQMKQRFREQLRHEIFHFWMPNNLNLSGNYSWFYEGFAQYTALRSGVALNQISFSDFLNTLEQANNLTGRRSQPISLVEASKNRWINENSSVYAKGLAVAFLMDVALLKQSGGKQDLISVMRRIYDTHKFPNKKEDGNAAVMTILESYKELAPVINAHIKGSEKLNFEKDLEQTGLEISSNGSDIKLQVKETLSGREKDFLDKLGYNNWRKILSK